MGQAFTEIQGVKSLYIKGVKSLSLTNKTEKAFVNDKDLTPIGIGLGGDYATA